MAQMKDHYTVLSESLVALPDDLLSADEKRTANTYLQAAIEITSEVVTDVPLSSQFLDGPFRGYRNKYLDALLHNNTNEAYAVIDEARAQKVPILNIYEDILKVVMNEIGGRMLSDLLEHDGWDTYYLGAAVPEKALLHAISEHEPDLIALSVTMPQHLQECESMIKTVKSRYPEVKITVGGRAFEMTSRIWEKWPIDQYADTAGKLIEWSHLAFQM